MMPIKIIVADDQALFRTGFETLFHNNTEMELVGSLPNGLALVTAVEHKRPDVVFSDIQMPVMSGIEATRIIAEKWPEIPVIGMSSFDQTDRILDILDAGARGYISKYCTQEVVFQAARVATRGGEYFCTDTQMKIAAVISSRRKNHSRPADLTPTETRIVKMICEGKETAEMASILNVSVGTVNRYRVEIAQKTETGNIPALVLYAVRKGICEP